MAGIDEIKKDAILLGVASSSLSRLLHGSLLEALKLYGMRNDFLVVNFQALKLEGSDLDSQEREDILKAFDSNFDLYNKDIERKLEDTAADLNEAIADGEEIYAVYNKVLALVARIKARFSPKP